MNVLKSHLRITIETLHRSGTPQREIQRRTGVDRKTIRHYTRLAKSPGVATGSGEDGEQTPPPRPPAPEGTPAAAAARTISACETHRAWIEEQVALGRNAVSIFQDLVESHRFTHRYNSVKRFVRMLKTRAPERFDVLEFLPGEDYGEPRVMLSAVPTPHKPI